MVAGAFKAQAVTLLEGIPDEPGRLVAANLRCLGRRAWRSHMLVVVPVSLIDFHDGLEIAAVVAPVGAHVRGTGVRSTDAAEMLQIGIEHLGIGSALLG